MHERGQRALEIRERHLLADHQAFDLREHRRVREIELIAAIHAAGGNQANRRREFLHVPDLHARRVRAEQRCGRADERSHGRREIERVLHVAGGMLRRHVERFEVVVVVLELRPVDDQEAEAREDRFDALAKNRQRMPMADSPNAAGQRDVDAACRGARRRRGLEARGEARVEIFLQLVDELTEARPVVGRHLSEALQQGGDEPALAREIAIADRPNIRLVRGGRQILLEPGPERVDVQFRS